MRFPNAYEGIRKIFTSEILMIISSVCALVAGIGAIIVAALVGASAATGADVTGAIAGGGVAFLIFTLGSAVLAIIALILNLIGLKRAGLDEDDFNKGFIFAIVSLLLVIASGIVSSMFGQSPADEIVAAVSKVMQLCVTLYVIRGITKLADQLGEEGMSTSGKRFYIFYLILMIVGLVLQIVGPFLGKNDLVSTAAGVLASLSAVATLAAFIIYLIYLGKAKKMLKNN